MNGYNFMTCEEMLAKLDLGETPLELSIEKWDRIVDYHRLNGRQLSSDRDEDLYYVSSDTCALCSIYYAHTGCNKCPYYKNYQQSCDNINGHWSAYIRFPSMESAISMRDALRAIL